MNPSLHGGAQSRTGAFTIVLITSSGASVELCSLDVTLDFINLRA
jgi:hypothetical protein